MRENKSKSFVKGLTWKCRLIETVTSQLVNRFNIEKLELDIFGMRLVIIMKTPLSF